jgi:hypothetical protein
MARGRNAEGCRQMLAQRGPKTDPRDGQLLKHIRYEYYETGGGHITTSQLVDRAYFWWRFQYRRPTQNWQRESARRALRKVALLLAR